MSQGSDTSVRDMSLREKMRVKMSQVLGVPLARIQDGEPLVDLVAESFMLIEMLIELQETYSIRLDREDLEQIRTVDELLTLLEGRVGAIAG